MKSKIRKVSSISEFHRIRGLSGPLHPLVSLVDYSQTTILPEYIGERWVLNFYSIGLKRNVGTLRYGQQRYDFDEGLMSFIAPGQTVSIEPNNKPGLKPSGWILLIHPDFLWNSDLASKILQYEFFGYAINEALFLSEKEEKTIIDIFQNIKNEYHSNIDKYSQRIIIAQLELLLSYAQRFYSRQFITREIANHEVLGKLEQILADYFDGDEVVEKGLPSVQSIAGELNMSSTYLSSLLKSLTGQSTQHHIHEKLIAKAKEKLSTTQMTISEIAYAMGFEHSQSFSKLFKSKTEMTPVEFRESFN